MGEFIETPAGKLWLEQVEEEPTSRPPLITVHGGPGFSHNYLKPLAALARSRKVVFYDQLDCGQSDRPGNKEFWTTEYFTTELASVVAASAPESKVHLFGHSWGAIPVLEYAIKHPEKVASIIFASPSISLPRWIEDAAALTKRLPRKTQEAICQNLDTNDERYQEAREDYYKRYVYRLEERSHYLRESDALAGAACYLHMWGRSEFEVTGSLRSYDGTPLLARLSCPVLYTCGYYDEATPKTCLSYSRETASKNTVSVFYSSSHLPHIEEQESYLTDLNSFLAEVDEKEFPNSERAKRNKRLRMKLRLKRFTQYSVKLLYSPFDQHQS